MERGKKHNADCDIAALNQSVTVAHTRKEYCYVDRNEDKPKTAMMTPMGQFQFKVLCFGLTNAPATFQRAMNKIFSKHIGKFVLVYLMTFWSCLVRLRSMSSTLGLFVLHILRENGLKAKLSKCECNKAELHFLGHIIGKGGVAMDPAKIVVIEKWPLPKSLKELQSFLGLANYFRKFVDHFSSVVAPLTALTGATGKGRARKPIQAVDWNNLSEEQVKALGD